MSKPTTIYYVFAVLAVFYLILNLVLPPEAATLTRYHVSASRAHALGLSVVIPFIAIWFVAFFGYVRFKAYALLIHKEKDGKAMETVANGLKYLALSLPLASIVSLLASSAGSHNKHYIASGVIASNYINLSVLFLAFFLLLKGSSELVSTVKYSSSRPKIILLTLLFIFISAFYTYGTLANPARRNPTALVDRAAYYLPDWLIIVTIVLPYLYIWYSGIRTAYNLHLYMKNVAGIIYKKAFNQLAWGVAFTVVSVMIMRLLSSVSTYLNHLTLNILLATIYALLIVIGFGYGMLAMAAKKLRQIEEA